MRTFPQTAEQLRVKPLELYVWPVTYRFHEQHPWGRTQHELTVDCPALQGELTPTMNLGVELWTRGFARAKTVGVQLLAVDTVAWRFQPSALPLDVFGAHGTAAGTASSREQSPCLVLHTGHDDPLGRRRITLAGAPSSWSYEGLITTEGFTNVLTVARGLYEGLAGLSTGGPMVWLIAYPELLPASSTNPNGVAFRTVEWIRACHLTERAPEPSGQPWP